MKLLHLRIALLAAAGPMASAQDVATHTNSHRVVVDCLDGSRLVGDTTTTEIHIKTSYLDLRLPLSRIRSISRGEREAEDTLTMENGDQLRGDIGNAVLPLNTAFGGLTVPFPLVQRLSVLRLGVMPEGLVLHYTFDKKGDETEDSSDQGNHGAVNGPVWIEDGKRGGALRFDGVDDHVDCGAGQSLQVAGALTYAMWLRIPAESPPQRVGTVMGRCTAGETASDIASVLKMQNGLLFGGVCGPEFRRANTLYSPKELRIANGQWRHVAFVYEPGESIRLHLDGRLVKEETGGIFPSLNPRRLPVQIGASGGRLGFAGDLDEVMVFSRPLDVAEIVQLHAAK